MSVTKLTTAIDDSTHVHRETMEQPANDAMEVVPSDTIDLSFVSRALYIGTGGTLKVRMASGRTVTFAAVGAGLIPIRVIQVFNTGTSASGIVNLW